MTNPFTSGATAVYYDTDANAVHAAVNAPRGDRERIMSRSELVKFSECPHKWLKSRNQTPTAAMILGDMTDCFVLCPQFFEKRYAVSPDVYPSTPAATKKNPFPDTEEKPWNYQSKYCKDWRKNREAEGKICVTSESVEEANEMARSVMNDERLAEFIQCSRKQALVHVTYRDPETAIEIAVRMIIDLVPDPKHPQYGNCLGDLKSACDANPFAWAKAVYNQKYYYQSSIYLDGINAALGTAYRHFYHLVVESEHPYEPARRIVPEEFLTLGRMEYRRDLARYCRCLAEGVWPSYDDEDDVPAHPIYDGWRFANPAEWMIKAALK